MEDFINLKDEPLSYDLSNVDSACGSEVVNIIEELKTELESNINMKLEPLDYVCNDTDSISGFEEANVIQVLKSDLNIKHEPLDYKHNDSDFLSVRGFHATLAKEKFIKREVEENEEEEKVDIKCEYLDYEVERSAIEDASESVEKHFGCPKCNFKSKYKNALKRHIITIHEKEKARRYACELCSHETIDKGNLNKHMIFRHGKKGKRFKCSECGFIFKQNSDLKKHIWIIHEKKKAPRYACELFTASHPILASEKFIKKEVEGNEEETKYIKFDNLDYGLERSIIENFNESVEKHFECPKCSFKSKYRSALKRHITAIHEKEKAPRHTCESCSYETIDKQAFSRHMMNRHGIKKKHFECYNCGYKFTQKSALKKHILIIHGDAPRYACELCKYETTNKYYLNTHMNVHEKEREQFKCDKCQYNTKNILCLNEHMRIHTKLGIECNLCQKPFKNESSLNRHYAFKHFSRHKCSKCSSSTICTNIQMLTQETDPNKFKFQCHTCGYRCSRKSMLKTHVRVHRDHLPFACIACNKRFNRKGQLNSHIVSQHKENEQLMESITCKIHQCPKCTYKTAKIDSLRRHINCCKY